MTPNTQDLIEKGQSFAEFLLHCNRERKATLSFTTQLSSFCSFNTSFSEAASFPDISVTLFCSCVFSCRQKGEDPLDVVGPHLTGQPHQPEGFSRML